MCSKIIEYKKKRLCRILLFEPLDEIVKECSECFCRRPVLVQELHSFQARLADRRAQREVVIHLLPVVRDGLPHRSIAILLQGSRSEAGLVDDDDHGFWIGHTSKEDVDEVDLLILLSRSSRCHQTESCDALVAHVEAPLLDLPDGVLSDRQPLESLLHHGTLSSE